MLALVAAGFTACSDDDFQAGPGVDGAQVYFPETIPEQINLEENASSFTIPVKRVATEGALSVAIMGEDESGLFTVPSSVTFPDGKASVDLVITYDKSQIDGDKEYPIALLINDDNNSTPYGYRTIKFTVALWPWVLMEANEGKGKYREDFFSGMFGGLPNPEVEVKIYKHKSKPGIYMVEEMFGWNVLTETLGDTQAALEAEVCTYNPTNITIDASDPNEVFIPTQQTGIVMKMDNYGRLRIMTAQPGTLTEGVITFPKQGILMNVEAVHDDQHGSPANRGGMFRIILPGYEATDFSLTATYDGMKVSADGETASAVIDFACGADVTGISYVFAPGDVTAEADTYAAKIADGTADNIAQVPDFVKGTEKVSIQAEIGDAGNYTIIAVPHDNTNEPRAKEVAATTFYFPGMGGAIPDVDATVELMLVSEFNPQLLPQYPDHSSIAYKFSGTDIVAAKYYLNTKDLVDLLESGADPDLPTKEEVMAQYAFDFEAEELESIRTNGYTGGIFGKRSPNTAYRLMIQAKNSYGKTAIIFSEPATTAEVPYSGEMVVGKYTMTHVANPTTTFTNVFDVIPTVGSDTKFQIKDFAANNEGTLWNAVYDPTASTLTLDGTIQGGESATKNYFGEIMGFWDAAETLVYGYASFATAEGTGADPCVIEVNPTTKQLSVLKNQIQVSVLNAQSGELAGYGGFYVFNTPITKVAASSSVTSLMPEIRSINVPFSSIRVPADKNSLRKLRFGMMAAESVPMAGFSSGGLRTLSVKASKCETRSKQLELRSSLGSDVLKAVK